MGDICRFFNTASGCYFGDQCRFSHGMPYDMYSGWYQDQHRFRGVPPPPPTSMAPPPPYMLPDMQHDYYSFKPCRFFNLPNGCRHGDRCVFYHDYSQRGHKRNDHNNNRNNNGQKLNTVKNDKIIINDISCGECGKEVKSGNTKTAKQNLSQHYVEKLAGCDDKHIKYFLSEADFALRDLVCFPCGKKYEEVQDLLHHFYKHLKGKNKQKYKHQEHLSKIVKPFVDRDWNATVSKLKNEVVSVPLESDGSQDSFTMKLLKNMVKPKDLTDGKEGGTGSMMRNLARLIRTTSESSGGSGSRTTSISNPPASNNGSGKSTGDEDDDDEDDEFDPALEDELEERANNMGYTKGELEKLKSHGVNPEDDDAWERLQEILEKKIKSDDVNAESSSVEATDAATITHVSDESGDKNPSSTKPAVVTKPGNMAESTKAAGDGKKIQKKDGKSKATGGGKKPLKKGKSNEKKESSKKVTILEKPTVLVAKS